VNSPRKGEAWKGPGMKASGTAHNTHRSRSKCLGQSDAGARVTEVRQKRDYWNSEKKASLWKGGPRNSATQRGLPASRVAARGYEKENKKQHGETFTEGEGGKRSKKGVSSTIDRGRALPLPEGTSSTEKPSRNLIVKALPCQGRGGRTVVVF